MLTCVLNQVRLRATTTPMAPAANSNQVLRSGAAVSAAARDNAMAVSALGVAAARSNEAVTRNSVRSSCIPCDMMQIHLVDEGAHLMRFQRPMSIKKHAISSG